MKNLFFIFIVFFSFACSSEKEAVPGEGQVQSFSEGKVPQANFENITYSDEKIVYFSSNWENKSGSEAFNRLIKPLIQKDVDIVLDFVTVYESDERIMEASMCLDSVEKQNEYRSNALASYDAWSSLEGDVNLFWAWLQKAIGLLWQHVLRVASMPMMQNQKEKWLLMALLKGVTLRYLPHMV